MRPEGNAEELERRRRRAVQLMWEGESPTLIARILGVARQSLYRWRDMARAGPKGLAAKPPPGRKRRLKFYVTKYEKTAAKLSVWMEENLPEGLTVFALPEGHRKRMRTTNMLERVHEELNRRTRVAGLFPNKASLLPLVSAVLMELSEEWETGKRYLNMHVENDDSASEQNKIYRKNAA